MTDVAVRVAGVSKTFARRRPGSVKQVLVSGSRPAPRERVHALRAVSLEVPAHRTVGLIGHNGAGKSTLLRLIGGVGRPDAGRVQVEGRVSALFELGTGLHPELTGRESVMVAGVIAGLSRRQVRERLDAVVEFADLAEFLDQPTRTYSTGMQARLAFATAVHVDPDVLLVDEVLAVGDLAFQARCLDRIRAMQRAGVTIVLVSHDPYLVDELCDEVVWLQGGRVVGQGGPREVTARYRAAMEEETRRRTPASAPVGYTSAGRPLRVHENRFGSLEGEVAEVWVTDPWGVACERIATGDALRVQVDVRLPEGATSGNVGVTLARADGVLCLDTATAVSAPPGGAARAELTVDRLDLAAGAYAVSVGLFSDDWAQTLDYHWGAYPLHVEGVVVASAPLLAPPSRWALPSEHPALRGPLARWWAVRSPHEPAAPPPPRAGAGGAGHAGRARGADDGVGGL